jgi:hypothetical protein
MKIRERILEEDMTVDERNLLELSQTLQEALVLLDLLNKKLNHAITLRHRTAIHRALNRGHEPCPGCDNPDHEERE